MWRLKREMVPGPPKPLVYQNNILICIYVSVMKLQKLQCTMFRLLWLYISLLNHRLQLKLCEFVGNYVGYSLGINFTD